MAYLKPPFFVRRIFNKLAIKFSIGGSEALTVQGRRSGREQTIPVIPVDVDGVRYLVSTRGESEWVRNLRASGRCTLRCKGGTRTLLAREVPTQARAGVLSAYRQKAGSFVDGYFAALPDAHDHPVFELASA